MIFSKTYCPFCTKTKDLFAKEGAGYDVVVMELDKMDGGADIQSALLDLTGQRTVPNVFIRGQHLGGNDDSQAAARSGKLQAMLSGGGDSVAMMSASGGMPLQCAGAEQDAGEDGCADPAGISWVHWWVAIGVSCSQFTSRCSGLSS